MGGKRYRKETIIQAKNLYYKLGNISKVAKELDIAPTNVNRWCKHYGWAKVRRRRLVAATQKAADRREVIKKKRAAAKRKKTIQPGICTCCQKRPIKDGNRFLCTYCFQRRSNGDDYNQY